jgi:hypothetical protein
VVDTVDQREQRTVGCDVIGPVGYKPTISGRRSGAFTILMMFAPTEEHHRKVMERIDRTEVSG